MAHPYWTILPTLAITIFFAIQIPKIKIDPRVEIYLSDKNPVRAVFLKNHETFEFREDIIVGLINENGIFNEKTLQKIQNLSSDIENIPTVRDVTSLLNVDYITGSAEGLDVKPMVESGKAPRSPEEILDFKQKLGSWDLYKGLLFTIDEKGTLISFSIQKGLQSNDVVPVYYNLLDITKKYEGQEKFFIAGTTVVESLIGDYMMRDLKLFVPFVNIAIIIFLFLFFRNMTGVLLPLVTVSISTIWVLGLMAILRVPITSVSSTIPVVLVAMGTAYGIHVLENIFADNAENNKNEKVIIHNALYRVSTPVIMAGLTTIAGSVSLVTTEVVPIREFGLLAGFGIMVAMVISLTIIPAILSILKNKGRNFVPNHYQSRNDLIDSALKWASHQVYRRSMTILVISLIIIAVSMVGVLQLKSDLDPIKHFRKSSPIRVADDILNKEFGGTTLFNVVIEGKSPDDIKDPAFLRYVEGLQNRLNKMKGVGKTVTIVDLIKRMNRSMHGGDIAYYRIPETRELVAQYLLLYSFSGGKTLDRIVDFNCQKTQILMQVKSQSGLLADEVAQVVKAYQKQTPADRVKKVFTTGISAMNAEFNRIVVSGQISSCATSLLLVMLIVVVIFKSFKLGLFSIIPLFVPIVFNFGIMGFLGIELNAATAIIASLAVGVGIDYQIHVISRYRYEMELNSNIPSALEQSIYTSGRAILYNAIAVTAGFMVLIPSNFVIICQMGFLQAMVMVTCAVASLTLLPAAMNVFRSKDKTKGCDEINGKI